MADLEVSLSSLPSLPRVVATEGNRIEKFSSEFPYWKPGWVPVTAKFDLVFTVYIFFSQLVVNISKRDVLDELWGKARLLELLRQNNIYASVQSSGVLRTFCGDSNVTLLSITAATSHEWLSSIWNVACLSEEQNFKFCLLLVKFPKRLSYWTPRFWQPNRLREL